jgi:hypothetical protein
MAGVCGIGQHGGSFHQVSAPTGERTVSRGDAKPDVPGQRVRESVHEAKARFRAERGFRNQGQAIRAALDALRHPEPEATEADTDGDGAIGAADTGSDATGSVTDAPLGTQGTLDLLA